MGRGGSRQADRGAKEETKKEMESIIEFFNKENSGTRSFHW